MQNLNWDDFENGKIAVNCDTEEKAEFFLKECFLRGIKWTENPGNLSTYWGVYMKGTTYCCLREPKKLECCNKTYYQTRRITVLEFKGIPISKECLKDDNVIKPSHYKAGEFDVIAFCQKHNLNFDVGNVIKYVTRAGKKKDNSELQDLNKAMEYLKRRIEFVKGDK